MRFFLVFIVLITIRISSFSIEKEAVATSKPYFISKEHITPQEAINRFKTTDLS